MKRTKISAMLLTIAMIMIKITTDSTCDLPDALLRENDITVVPLGIVKGEKLYRDGVDIHPADIASHERSVIVRIHNAGFHKSAETDRIADTVAHGSDDSQSSYSGRQRSNISAVIRTGNARRNRQLQRDRIGFRHRMSRY